MWWSAAAFVVLAAFWLAADASTGTKLVVTGIFVALWVLAFFWEPAIYIMFALALAIYAFFFGTEKGRRWRP
jgi:hypothetical protein